MTILSSDIDVSSGDAYDFSANFQTLVIKSGVVVESEDADRQAVFTNGFGQLTITNYGNISSSNYAVNLDGQTVLNNAASGLISGYAGVETSVGAQVNNQGTISGSVFGINNIDATAIINNDGTIYSGLYGIDSDGDRENIVNTGTISAYTGIEADFYATGQSAAIKNTGSIVGISAALKSAGQGALTLENSGRLDGAVTLGNRGGDTVYNQSGGEIDGNLKLGLGNNTFDGRGGSIEHGYIAGGAKIDTIHLGNDGESVNSGAGHDMLYAGTGDDTFAFTSYAAADSDTIFGFNVARDVVQLNHAEFTKLTAGTTPTFSVGTAASSPTDHLFYNSGSGNLFYDPDGSGAGHADVIAKLDPFLKMTAHDFKVI